jgi:hypothetical protein
MSHCTEFHQKTKIWRTDDDYRRQQGTRTSTLEPVANQRATNGVRLLVVKTAVAEQQQKSKNRVGHKKWNLQIRTITKTETKPIRTLAHHWQPTWTTHAKSHHFFMSLRTTTAMIKIGQPQQNRTDASEDVNVGIQTSNDQQEPVNKIWL